MVAEELEVGAPLSGFVALKGVDIINAEARPFSDLYSDVFGRGWVCSWQVPVKCLVAVADQAGK